MSINYQNYYILKLLTQKNVTFYRSTLVMNRKYSFSVLLSRMYILAKNAYFFPHPYVENTFFLPYFFTTRDRFKFANDMIYARSAKNFALFKPFHKNWLLR